MTNVTKLAPKKDMYAELLTYKEVQANSDMVEFINHELELLARKNAGKRKPTEEQIMGKQIQELMIAEMRANPDRLYSATELAKIVQPNFTKLITNQRITALMRAFLEDKGTGEVKKVVDKRKTFFQIA